jgi:D-tagatose-1,6-bisphosphate aldolase subunit GatZ/KbaZ
VYVIGTEVPVPGGTKEDEQLEVTGCADVERFITVSREEFRRRNLDSAWDRVIAVVVQPGVEFGSHSIIDYDRTSASNLSRFIESYDTMVYEAHSTDYQKKESLRQMVEDHFCILKVGPWLTYAFREAVFALETIEQELLGKKRGVNLSHLYQIIDKVMLDDPRYWEKYYQGTEDEQAFDRMYSLSDRIRYYWQNPKVTSALERLMKNLSGTDIPLSLISRFFPMEYDAVRDGRLSNSPSELVIERIISVLKLYSYACNMT